MRSSHDHVLAKYAPNTLPNAKKPVSRVNTAYAWSMRFRISENNVCLLFRLLPRTRHPSGLDVVALLLIVVVPMAPPLMMLICAGKMLRGSMAALIGCLVFSISIFAVSLLGQLAFVGIALGLPFVKLIQSISRGP